MVVKGAAMQIPDVPLPIRSSLGQDTLVHRFQLSRNLRLLRNYGMRPDYPVLKAQSTAFRGRVVKQTPTPQLTRFGVRPRPGLTPVYPRVGAPGTMGSVKRFSKASKVIPNRYRPPLYGGGTQVQNLSPGLTLDQGTGNE